MLISKLAIPSLIILNLIQSAFSQDNDSNMHVCGGFIEFDESINPQTKANIAFSSILIKTFTVDHIMKEQTSVADSGYYFLPVYEQETIILSISAPYGMTFEPDHYILDFSEAEKSIEEMCKTDYNFKFRGFKVSGQISTFGSLEGPEGIDLSLYAFHDRKGKLQTATTLEGGHFSFSPIYPGKYLLQPTHEKDRDIFDPNHLELAFDVKVNESNFLEKALIVRGYKVTGYVYSQNTLLEGVFAFIYSYDKALTDSYICKTSEGIDLNTHKDDTLIPFCVVKSNSQGQFRFTNIPFGKFKVKVFFSDNDSSFAFIKESQEIEVAHKDLTLQNKFEVGSLSVKGRVVDAVGKGIPTATIKIDGQIKAKTDESGYYLLENLSSGSYDIEAQIENMYFDPLSNIQISPIKRKLPNLIVKEYKLCGLIQIEANEYISTSKRTVVLNEFDSKKERRTITDNQGKYCFDVTPGKYHIYPFLTQEEKDMELHLNPDSIDVEVSDKPVLDVNFYQSKVEISGEVKCLGECHDNIEIYLSSVKTEKEVKTLAKKNNDKYTFAFTSILSGQYKVYIKKLEWCWKNEEQIIKVQNTPITNINFIQTGYSMFYHSVNDINVSIESADGFKVKTTLKKNESKLCLPQEGEYKIIPQSCHKFKNEFFTYSTKSIERLSIVPFEYLVKGEIEVTSKVFQLLNKEISGITVDVMIEEITSDDLLSYKKVENAISENNRKSVFDFFTKPKTNLLITPEVKLLNPSSNNTDYIANVNKLLFYPKHKQIKVEENCSENPENLKFELRAGQVIGGKVTPPMEGVRILAYNKENGELLAQVETKEDGQYTIGPLYVEFKYELKALKDGYKIVQAKENKHDFTAEKLSFLRVRVVDTNNKPLPAVFISLSSSNKSFKINNNTNSEGYFDFYELYSGDYYIKPLLKEYKFEPAQKQVTIVGGEHYEELIVAHRVAYSVFGKVNNLNKDKVEGISIQAINIATQQITETQVDKNMEYRLRGLIPNQKYLIKAKIPLKSNIEKALPQATPLLIEYADVTGVDFILMAKPSKVDIRGYVSFVDENDKCPLERVKNIRVELKEINEVTEKDPIVKKLSHTCIFALTKLEKANYQIRLIEKQGKSYTKTLYEEQIDLNEDKEIADGVKNLSINISKSKGGLQDHINYSIFSPTFICILLFIIFKWELCLRLFNKIVSLLSGEQKKVEFENKYPSKNQKRKNN